MFIGAIEKVPGAASSGLWQWRGRTHDLRQEVEEGIVSNVLQVQVQGRLAGCEAVVDGARGGAADLSG